jgi:hypothetical protein
MTPIVHGRSLADIGKEMSLTVKTVSTYRTRILEKLDVRSNAELVRYARNASLSLGITIGSDRHRGSIGNRIARCISRFSLSIAAQSL